MAEQKTLSIVKPDAVGKSNIGKILARLEEGGLRIVQARLVYMDRPMAEKFYAEHAERPFFASLIEFMTSGPSMIMVLSGEDAIAHNRQLMGATDPAKADPGTIRADFAESIERNAVHGSDSPEAAEREIGFFFPAS
ncbi:MAG: nucleoside-diphosphate kinase [Betaproteobacteria bacterium]|nr:nucleoside-diphosphate kinase [Betaproteobacteria bacterium]